MKDFLSLLHYYKGEDKNPFDIDTPSNSYWELEYMWYNQVVNDEYMTKEYLEEFFIDFPGLCDNISKETPTSLKSFLYNRYTQFGGSKEGFESWLMQYIQNAES